MNNEELWIEAIYYLNYILSSFSLILCILILFFYFPQLNKIRRDKKVELSTLIALLIFSLLVMNLGNLLYFCKLTFRLHHFCV